MKLVYVALVALVAGAGLSRYFWPVQSKTITEQKEVVRTDVRTVIKLVERPDGSKETVTEIVDNSTSTSKAKQVAVLTKRSEWLVGGSVATNFADEPIYGLSASKRIIGPFYVGFTANTERQLGLTLQMEF